MSNVLLKNTLSLGNFEIHIYAICILTGILVAYVIGLYQAKRLGVKKEIISDGLIYCVPLAIIGARIYYVLFSLDSYKHDPMDVFRIWQGGLAIHGGILTAIIFILIYCKIRNVSLWKIFEIVFPGFLIAQMLGRWGNFFNQEAYGEIIKSQWIIDTLYNILPDFIMDNMKDLQLKGYWNHPTFLYEGFINLIGFILIQILRKFKFYKTGDALPFYLVWYGINRFMIEQTRTDALMIGRFRQNVIISLVFVIVGIGFFIFKRLYFKDINSYKDDVNNNILGQTDEEYNI